MEPLVSGAKVQEERQQQAAIVADAREKIENKLNPVLVDDTLLTIVKTAHNDAESERIARGITQMLEDSLRRRNGMYADSDVQNFTKQGQPVVWVGLTETKCTNGEAWANDIIDSVGQEYFSMVPSPRPDLNTITKDIVTRRLADEIEAAQAQGQVLDTKTLMSLRRKFLQEEHEITMAEITEATDNLRTAVSDVLTEIDFNENKKQMLSDAITFGTGFIKGPIVFTARKGEWQDNEFYINDKKLSIFVTNPHPMDMFPAPSSCRIQDNYVVERVRIGLYDAQHMLDAEGYLHANVKLAIDDWRGSIQTQVGDTGRTILENKPVQPRESENQFEYFEYWGALKGKYISEYLTGVEDEESYHVQVLFTKQYILKVMLNPLMAIPYRSASYKQTKGSIWGRSVPQLIKEAQDILNGTARALVKNIGISSGPQAIVDRSQLDPKVDHTQVIPFGQWILNGQAMPGISRKPVEFFVPESRMTELMQVAQWCNALADNRCSIPAYTYGNDAVASVGQTSSGLSMMLNAAGRGMKDTLSSIDKACAGAVKLIAEWILMYPDTFGYGDEIKGDANVVVKGSMGVLLVELRQARMKEFGAMLMSPDLKKYVLPDGGWVKFLRQMARMMDIPVDGILPKESEHLYAQNAEQENLQKMQLQKLLEGAAGAQSGAKGVSMDTVEGQNANPDKIELTPPNTQGLGGGVENG